MMDKGVILAGMWDPEITEDGDPGYGLGGEVKS